MHETHEMNKIHEKQKRGYSEIEAADYIGMSTSFLRQDRCHGFRHKRTPGPNFVRVGRTIRYLKEELDAWLEKHYVNRNIY